MVAVLVQWGGPVSGLRVLSVTQGDRVLGPQAVCYDLEDVFSLACGRGGFPWYAKGWWCSACRAMAMYAADSRSYHEVRQEFSHAKEGVDDAEPSPASHVATAVYVHAARRCILAIDMVVQESDSAWLQCLIRHPGLGWRIPVRAKE